MSKPWDVDLSLYPTEPELLEALRKGESDACTCLMQLFTARLYRLAVKVTGDEDDAEDVLQETFIKACGQIDRFEARSGLGSWLYRIVMNNALMHLRKQASHPVPLAVGQDGEEGPLAGALADRESDPGENLLSLELRRAVEQAILDLPDTLRSAFVLRDMEGMSTLETARELGISEAAVKVRLHRARLALREGLASYLAEPATTTAQQEEKG